MIGRKTKPVSRLKREGGKSQKTRLQVAESKANRLPLDFRLKLGYVCSCTTGSGAGGNPAREFPERPATEGSSGYLVMSTQPMPDTPWRSNGGQPVFLGPRCCQREKSMGHVYMCRAPAPLISNQIKKNCQTAALQARLVPEKRRSLPLPQSCRRTRCFSPQRSQRAQREQRSPVLRKRRARAATVTKLISNLSAA